MMAIAWRVAMSRFAACFAFVLRSAGLAVADIPPPDGTRRVPLDNIIESDQAFPDYVLFVVVGGNEQWTFRSDIGPGKPIRITGAGRNGIARMCWLAAIHAGAAKAYTDDAELVRAVAGDKVPGTQKSKVHFDSFVVRRESGAPESVEQHYKLERIDTKDGVVLTPIGDVVGSDDGAATSDEGRSILRPAIIAIAACFAVAGLGLWIVRRRRGPA